MTVRMKFSKPLQLQICYLKQFHAILSDDEIQDKSSFKGILQFGRRMVTHLFGRLDPKPVSLDKQKEKQDEQGDKDKGEDRQLYFFVVNEASKRLYTRLCCAFHSGCGVCRHRCGSASFPC